MNKRRRYKPTINKGIGDYKQKFSCKIQSRKKQLIARAN